ncbi:MAG TPA: single-stranded DNA-binding protein [Aquificaceae bacterium]|nr:single-stranded DNA-binding protein [Aquificaceae bacterium]
MLNKVLIIGWLTSDPVVKYLPSGTAVAEFGVAWNRRYRIDEEWKEESHFFDVKAYGRLAEDLSSRLSKGYQVIVEGRLSQDRWTGQDGKNYSRVRIVAESVRIIRKPKLEEVEEEDVSPQDKDPFGDDDIPF